MASIHASAIATLCLVCLGAASAFMIPSPLGLSLRASTSSVSVRRAAVSSISMQAVDELKLFVGGLPWAMDSESLREAFTEFGQVQDANIVMDRETGRSRGFGFVTFAEKSQAEAACNQMNQAEINGRTINVNFAKARPPREAGGGYSRGPRSNY